MPARSNRFQTLVRQVQEQLATTSCIVRESQMLRDLRDGKEREVDIVVEGQVGPHSVIVSVEATDGARPASIEWVERMCAKHQYLPTNKLILASRSGFTKSAASEARSRGAMPIALSEASRLDWRTEIQLQTVRIQHRRLFPSDFRVETVAPIGAAGGPFNFAEAVVSFDGGARRVGLTRIIQGALADVELGTAVDADRTGPEAWSSRIRLQFREGTTLELGHGVSFSIRMLHFTARYEEYVDDVVLSFGRLGGTPVAHGSARTMAGELVVTISEAEDGAVTMQAGFVEGTATGIGLVLVGREPVGDV